MTQALEKVFREVSKLPNEEQNAFADFLWHELAFRVAVREGMEAADRGETTSLDEVKKMVSQWASK